MRWQRSLVRLVQHIGNPCRSTPSLAQQQWAACLVSFSQHSLGGALHETCTSSAAQQLPALSLHAFQPHRQFFNLPGSNTQDLSKHYRERRLIGYSPDQLYDVVSRVENYEEFVPWCERSTVLRRQGDDYMEAELEVGFKVFVERYTSKVTLEKNKRVLTKVADSTLFNSLDNRWEFEPGPTANSCWLTFTIDFAFKSPLYGQLATVFFKEVVQQMMGAFEGRCQQKFGPSSFNAKKGFQRTAPVRS